MIAIRLLGGARRALGGRNELHFDKPSGTVAEILMFLQNQSLDPRLLVRSNLIIAINGVDSSALQGNEALAKSGDTVTIVTVVHGGSTCLLEGVHAAVLGIAGTDVTESGELLRMLRKSNPRVAIQVLRADSVFGIEHVVEALRIVMASEQRGTMIANRAETELLLRLACTNQISEAVSLVGFKSGKPACIVGFSEQPNDVRNFVTFVSNAYRVDQSVLLPEDGKATALIERLGLPTNGIHDILLHLIERAAILSK